MNLTAFTAISPGSVSAALSIFTKNAASGYSNAVPVSLSGNIVSSSAFLVLTPSEVSFGSVVINSTDATIGVSSSMYIKNIGTQPFAITGYLYSFDDVDSIGDSTDWFSLMVPSSGSSWTINDGFSAQLPSIGTFVAGGSSLVVDLKFLPPQIGDFSLWIAVNTTAGYKVIAISGVASSAPIGTLTISTNENGWTSSPNIDFGNLYGGTTVFRKIMISSTGGTSLEITKSKPPEGLQLYATNPENDLHGTILLFVLQFCQDLL